MTISASARKNKIPRKTLADHVHQRVVNFPEPGVPRMLKDEKEEAVVEYVQHMAKRNMPLRRHDIRSCILVTNINTYW